MRFLRLTIITFYDIFVELDLISHSVVIEMLCRKDSTGCGVAKKEQLSLLDFTTDLCKKKKKFTSREKDFFWVCDRKLKWNVGEKSKRLNFNKMYFSATPIAGPKVTFIMCPKNSQTNKKTVYSAIWLLKKKSVATPTLNTSYEHTTHSKYFCLNSLFHILYFLDRFWFLIPVFKLHYSWLYIYAYSTECLANFTSLFWPCHSYLEPSSYGKPHWNNNFI